MQQDAVLCKLFATESNYAVLLKHGGGDVGSPDPSATGNTVYKALCVNNTTKPEFLAAFKARLTCTDQAAYNYVAEEKMVDAWGDKWTGCHTACNLHVVARVLTRTIVGSLSSEAIAYKKFVMDLFLQTGTRKDIRKNLLSSVATGDWRKDELEVYVAPGVSYDATELRLLVIKGLIISLASTVFHTYPRHRWTGVDLSTDQVGLLLAVHNVGASALVLMASNTRRPKEHSDTHFVEGERRLEEAV
eukprot:2853165-Amphidinium_carterae.2